MHYRRDIGEKALMAQGSRLRAQAVERELSS